MNTELTPATALTLQIVDTINQHGYYATRILTAGIYDPETQTWKRSGVERGTADIHACIRGVHVSIEIKVGRDHLRKKQEVVRQRVINAGGQYLRIDSFQTFYSWFNSFTQSI